MNSIISFLKNRRILILGFGIEGRSTLQFIEKYIPDTDVAIADRNPLPLENYKDKYPVFSGDDYLKDALLQYNDLVIKSPGIKMNAENLNDVEVASQTDLFLRSYADITIGVTGTKGKSTTASLVYHLLKSAGRNVFLAGNIGLPVFDIVPLLDKNSIVAFELSAHQLQRIHRSPHVGVFINLFEEHLDYFGTFQAYKEAKYNIFRYMKEGDIAVTNDSIASFIENKSINVVDYNSLDISLNKDLLPFRGEHNIKDAKAALCACKAMGEDVDKMLPYIYTFRPLQHRQEFVGTFHGVSFYNDSISTIPQTAVAALETISDVTFLLLGGLDRDVDYSFLVNYLVANPVKYVLYIGKAGKRIFEELVNASYKGIMLHYDTMEEAFNIIKSYASPGDVCLLSPAAASYDKYVNFQERGTLFKNLATKF